MRRLVLLLSTIVALDITFFTALTPLLPHFAAQFDLSKTGAGILFAAYGAGVLAASIPGGVAASRVGPRQTALVGVALTASASFVFAFGDQAWLVGAARFAQGVGSAFSWAGSLAWLVAVAPRERRATLIGTTMGAAVIGALGGPALGAVATVAGVKATFAAVGALGFALSLRIVATPGVPAHAQPLSALRRMDAVLAGAAWLLVLPALLFGVLDVLAPLKLHHHGWSGVAIGALFLAAAAVEAVLNPLLGRLTDLRGALVPVRYALLASGALSIALAWTGSAVALAALVVAAGIAYGGFYTPGMALISIRAEQRDIAPGLVFGVMNGAWAAGNVVGPAAGGALAQLAGDSLPYLLLAALCLLTLLGTARAMPRYLQARSRPSSS
jgi:MFS family permease